MHAKAAARQAQLAEAAERQAREWSVLQTPDEMLVWLRKELQAKQVTAAQLMPVMDADRSGKIGMNAFERGLLGVGINIPHSGYAKLFRAVDVRRKKLLTKNDIVVMVDPDAQVSVVRCLLVLRCVVYCLLCTVHCVLCGACCMAWVVCHVLWVV